MWHVYVLESEKDGNRYVGMTDNLQRRLWLHNTGKVVPTEQRRPLNPIYIESFVNKYDAAAREQFLKTGWGKNYLQRTLKNYLKDKKLGG
jgi:putative endonuclease